MRKTMGCRKLAGLIVLGVILAIVLAVFTVGNGRSPAQPTGVHTVIPGSDAARIEIGKALAVPLKTAYMQIAGVKSANVVVIPTKEDKHFMVSGDAVIESGTDMLTVAEAMRNSSYRVLISAFVEFSVILYDGEQAVSYDWDNGTDKWRTGAVSTPTS